MADTTRAARRPAVLRLSLAGALAAIAVGLTCGEIGTGGCSNQKIQLGEQCPSPDNPAATVERGTMDAGPAIIYGTRCAPCDDSSPQLDARGCPIFVTFESCGGDICVGDTRYTRVPPDAGTSDAGEIDAGEELSAMEDAGGAP